MEKVGRVGARRDAMLAARKVKAKEGVEMGLVCVVCEDGEEAVRIAEEFGKRKWNDEIYAEIRKSMFPEICGVLGLATKAVIAPRLLSHLNRIKSLL